MNAKEARKNTKMLADKLDHTPTMDAIHKQIAASVLYDVILSIWDLIDAKYTNEEKYSILLRCIACLREEGYTVQDLYGTYKYKISWEEAA